MKDIKFDVAGVLGMGFIGALFATIRVRRSGADHYERFRREGKPVVFVVWHGQMLPLVHAHRNEGIVVLVSEHADGEYITRVLHRHGFGTARGSSTRGATRGLKGLIREARAGRDLALTPDGPKGPAREFKPGALAVAQVTGLPVIPLAVGASSAWRLTSWDGFLVPRPFSRVHVAYGEPLWVPREAGRDELDGMAIDVGRELDRLTALVEGEES
ncbi:MAG: lysophospholipid acyltransferase family protein [Gemmatimonadetes bacterium]|nr:lysophospholipid acyltransferase family protein [Gemmatimonadota bacterium]